MHRIAIVGTTGSGKSTLAERLAARLGGDFVDLDALNWGPGWTPAPVDVLRQRAGAALVGERWAAAGNYSRVRDIVWGRADTLIWLDYPLPVIYARLFRRTLRRTLRRERLWNDNRETLRAQFASRESLFYYAATTHRRRRVEFAAELARPEYAHLQVFRFRHPRELEGWLSELQNL